MCAMLVNRNCMESLRKDITDLQGTLVAVFSSVGAVRFPSWKFPDKVSCDLDLVALLERCDFAEDDPEFTQHSHVVLLELVIDRLLLLLQSFTGYTENLISGPAKPSPRATGPCMSLGLAVKKYWASMLKLGGLYRQLAAEKQHSKGDASDQRDSLRTTEAEQDRTQSSCSEPSESEVTLPSLTDGSLTARSQAGSAGGPAPSVRSAQTQTADLPPAPCEGCERARAGLREAGRAVADLCRSQNLPSSLSTFLQLAGEARGPDPLPAPDVSYWASEHGKDLSRIDKHLRALVELVNPLKGSLEESEKQKEALRGQLETLEGHLKKEKEAQAQERKEAQLLLERMNGESRQRVASLEKEREALENRLSSFEGSVSSLKATVQAQEATIRALEQAREDLRRELEAKTVDREEARKLEGQLRAQAGQLEEARQQLSWATTELEKERAKAESMLRHKESLQAKQRALTQQLDRLDRECEELKGRLADGEEERQELNERLTEVQGEKWEAQHRLEAQQKLTESLRRERRAAEQSAADLRRTVSELGERLREMKEKEKLLVFFPDLHVPVEARFESTGDVVGDMSQQLRANNIRISILEEENARLRGALAKMKEAAQSEGPKLVPPTQLWAPPPAKAGCEDVGRWSPGGYPVGTGCPGRSPPGRGRPGNAGWNRARSGSGHGTARDGTAPQRPPSGKLSKAPPGHGPRKAASHFPGEEAVARAQGRDPPPGHPARGTRSHQK